MSQVSPGIARLTAITALLGALIVILSQVVTGYSLENDLTEIVDTVTLLSKHGVMPIVFAVVAILAVIYAVTTGERTAAIVVVGMGLAVTLIFLIVDVPDIGETGLFSTEIAGNIDVSGKASAGLWMELTGGLILMLAGGALATLSPEQLRAIGPEREKKSPNKESGKASTKNPARRSG